MRRTPSGKRPCVQGGPSSDVSSGEGGFCFAQEALAKPGNALVVPGGGLCHFG